MLICDAHADTLWQMKFPDRPADLPFDITKEFLTQGDDVRVQALALFVGSNGMRDYDENIIQLELAAFERLKADGFVQITEISQAKAGVANVMLTIEGGEAFGDSVDAVDAFADMGVRIAAPIWNNENLLAHSATSGSGEGLKPLGHAVIAQMRKRHMAVDLSHLNIRGTMEVLDSDIPPIATHSCAYTLCKAARNLNDEQIRKLISAGGFIGVNFYPGFLDDSGAADISRVVDHMAYICDMGGESILGLGSDFDGIDKYPEGLYNAGDVPKLFDAMRKRGFDEKLVALIAGENFAAYMQRI
ncbi:MAG: hypothetical protein GX096_07195 [Clostridiales bacterium]|nr:hypothetical protein [Clostridiales bacterium]